MSFGPLLQWGTFHYIKCSKKSYSPKLVVNFFTVGSPFKWASQKGSQPKWEVSLNSTPGELIWQMPTWKKQICFKWATTLTYISKLNTRYGTVADTYYFWSLTRFAYAARSFLWEESLSQKQRFRDQDCELVVFDTLSDTIQYLNLIKKLSFQFKEKSAVSIKKDNAIQQ